MAGKKIVMRTGEALVEADEAWSAAEPEVVIGELDGPVGYAIANLLDNAAKFSRHAAPPTITIGGTRMERERILWVQDNGIGFDPSQYDKIFGLFERLHSPQEYEGTGVGLAIVKLVMEKHDGRVWVESTPGTGSTFYLAFPERAETVADRPPSPPDSNPA